MKSPVTFTVETLIPATPEKIFDTWHSSQGHESMTGAPAQASPETGAAFSAWDGYASGINVLVERPGHFVQQWRTTQFGSDEPDSLLTVRLHGEAEGTRVVITHENLPEHGNQYKQGWHDHYFEPMKAYFGRE